MRKITNDGLLLCEFQAKVFEISVEQEATSSEIFIRRFMKSDAAKLFDNETILNTNIQANDVIDMIDEEYGVSSYGSVKYSKNEMYWIGYIYRYFAYTYKRSTKEVYKIIKPKELRELFLPYHTLDCSQAIERILEAKGMLYDDISDLQYQYAVYKRIRESSIHNK